MALPFRPNCQPTSLGPLPHANPATAWDAVLRATPALPALPLLAGEGEALPLLCMEGFAGIDVQGTDLVLDRAAATNALNSLYASYLRGTSSTQAIELSALPRPQPGEQGPYRRVRAVFGLVLGPVSAALTLVDDQSEPVLADGELLDGLSKHIFLRRAWLSKMLERTGRPVIVWVYEPYFNITASSFCPLDADVLVSATDQSLGFGLPRALWLPDLGSAAMLPDSFTTDIIAMPLPQPELAEQARPLIERWLAQRSAIGWGIVPVTAEGLRSATVGRLAARFEAWLHALDTAGMPSSDLLASSLIMPEDTLAYLEPSEAEQALALTSELASLIRQSYGIE